MGFEGHLMDMDGYGIGGRMAGLTFGVCSIAFHYESTCTAYTLKA
jgi:hypothetical protein